MRISFPSHKFYGAFRFGSKSKAKILIIFENYEIKIKISPLRFAAVEMTGKEKKTSNFTLQTSNYFVSLHRKF